MKTFRLLYLRHSLLEQVEEVQADNALEAMGKAFGQPPDVTVEVWSDAGRVAVVGGHDTPYRQAKRGPRKTV